MFTFLSWASQQTIIWVGHFVAFASWAVLAGLLIRYLIEKDRTPFKITVLYALNSFSFLLAWWMILRTALIVVTPIEDTRQRTMDVILNESNRYFADHVQFTIIALMSFVLFDLAYMRYLVRRSVMRHVLILFGVNAVVLFLAVYLSVGTYYTGMLQEIDRHFLGH